MGGAERIFFPLLVVDSLGWHRRRTCGVLGSVGKALEDTIPQHWHWVHREACSGDCTCCCIVLLVTAGLSKHRRPTAEVLGTQIRFA